MARRILSDELWRQFEEVLVAVKDPRGAPAHLSDREFLEAVLHLARTGEPWRDLPSEFGTWIAVYMRFRRWEEIGVWRRLWEVLHQGAAPLALQVFVDSTSIPVHPHAAGARKKRREPGSGTFARWTHHKAARGLYRRSHCGSGRADRGPAPRQRPFR